MKLEEDRAILSKSEWYALLDQVRSPWVAFRREAAKDILCACFSGNIVADVRGAIRYADELIKQLREEER